MQDNTANTDAGVTSVAISPDGRLVAAGSLDTVVRLWDVATGQLLERLRGHKDSVYSVAFTPDGRGLVSGSLDKTLKYWELNTSALRALAENGPIKGGRMESGRYAHSVFNFIGHKDYVLSVAISHDGQWVVSGSKDRGVQFWDKNGNAQLMLQGHKNSGELYLLPSREGGLGLADALIVISIDLSPSGGHLATGSGDWQARVCTSLLCCRSRRVAHSSQGVTRRFHHLATELSLNEESEKRKKKKKKALWPIPRRHGFLDRCSFSAIYIFLYPCATVAFVEALYRSQFARLSCWLEFSVACPTTVAPAICRLHDDLIG